MHPAFSAARKHAKHSIPILIYCTRCVHFLCLYGFQCVLLSRKVWSYSSGFHTPAARLLFTKSHSRGAEGCLVLRGGGFGSREAFAHRPGGGEGEWGAIGWLPYSTWGGTRLSKSLVPVPADRWAMPEIFLPAAKKFFVMDMTCCDPAL